MIKDNVFSTGQGQLVKGGVEGGGGGAVLSSTTMGCGYDVTLHNT